jgi:hypothetical protein
MVLSVQSAIEAIIANVEIAIIAIKEELLQDGDKAR